MPPPTRSRLSHLDSVCWSVIQTFELLLPLEGSQFLTKPTVFLRQFHGPAHAPRRVRTSLCTLSTRTDFTVLVSKIPATKVQVSDSQTRTVMVMLLLFEQTSISHLATTLPPVSTTTRTTWLSQLRVTAPRAGSTFLTCSMRYTGTLPSLPISGLQDKESSRSFSPMEIPPATVSTLISSLDGTSQLCSKSSITVTPAPRVWTNAQVLSEVSTIHLHPATSPTPLLKTSRDS